MEKTTHMDGANRLEWNRLAKAAWFVEFFLIVAPRMVNSASFHRYNVRNLFFLNKLSGETKNIYFTLENHKTSYKQPPRILHRSDLSYHLRNFHQFLSLIVLVVLVSLSYHQTQPMNLRAVFVRRFPYEKKRITIKTTTFWWSQNHQAKPITHGVLPKVNSSHLKGRKGLSSFPTIFQGRKC